MTLENFNFLINIKLNFNQKRAAQNKQPFPNVIEHECLKQVIA